ncbi:hypothetical protein AURANDRAFT_69187, partial [Aureococcus anophagefferens]
VLAAAPRDFKRVCDHLVNCGAAAVRARFADPARALHAFNAGVVVFDLDRWRRRRLAADVERWVATNAAADPPIYRLGSNPPLVLAVGEDWARLDPRWNCMRGIHRQHPHNTACWRDAFVRHYPGGAKPWAMAPADAAALGWRFPRRAACAADLERRAERGEALVALAAARAAPARAGDASDAALDAARGDRLEALGRLAEAAAARGGGGGAARAAAALAARAAAPRAPERRAAPSFPATARGLARAAAFLDEHGYAVVRSAAAPAECEAILGMLWDWLEGLGTGLDRGDAATWVDGRWPLAAGASGAIPARE